MTLRRITIDISFKKNSQSEQTQSLSREKDSKSNTIKNTSLSEKQNKKLSPNIEKLI